MRSRVVILSSVKLIREGLALRIAQAVGSFALVDACGDVDAAIDAIRSSEANIAIVDHREGMEAVRRLREDTSAGIVVIGLRPEIARDMLACADSGVTEYLSSAAGVEELIEAIEQAVRGEAACAPRPDRAPARRIESDASATARDTAKAIASLTRREAGVLKLLQEGLSNKEIGRALNIQTATVKNHVHNILTKLRVSRRGEAIAQTLRSGGEAGRKAD